MPVLTFECCGRRYDDLKSFSTANPDLGKCPVCGKVGRQVPTRPAVHRGSVNEHLMDPAERQMLLDNKAMLEQMHISGDVDDGSFKVTEKGPNEFRPFGNDSFDRKKAKEEAQVIQ
jgi:hypothetical protein